MVLDETHAMRFPTDQPTQTSRHVCGRHHRTDRRTASRRGSCDSVTSDEANQTHRVSYLTRTIPRSGPEPQRTSIPLSLLQ